MNQALEKLRETINQIDKELLALMTRRADIAEDIFFKKMAYAKQHNKPPVIYDPDRERLSIEKLLAENKSKLSSFAIEKIFQSIIIECRNFQLEKLRKNSGLFVAIQGMEGSFNELAWKRYRQKNNMLVSTLIYAVTSSGVIQALNSGQADYGIVALYNTKGGFVDKTIEDVQSSFCHIIDSITLPVQHCLLALHGIDQSAVNCIYSHPQALKQCELYLKNNFPKATLIASDNTAKAASDLAAHHFSDENSAVIAGSQCAELYGLNMLDANIQDAENNETTFLILTKTRGEFHGQ